MRYAHESCSLFAALLVASLWNATALASTVISLDPRATYLHVCNDPAQNAIPLELAAYGVSAGDLVILEELGDWQPGCGGCPDTQNGLVAVFSGSDVLLGPSVMHRVQDAIDAGVDYQSGPPFNCQADSTNIPEDFIVFPDTAGGTMIVLPPGATHLFLSPGDWLFADNSDPDGDFALRITAVTLPVEAGSWGEIKTKFRRY